jgi:DnaJ-class molecular chaperone
MDSKVKCPECNGTGEVFSGYYGHPETSDGGPVMYWCPLCDGKKVVEEKIALNVKLKKIYDPF